MLGIEQRVAAECRPDFIFLGWRIGYFGPCVHLQLLDKIRGTLQETRVASIVYRRLECPPDILLGHQLCRRLVDRLAMFDAFNPGRD